MRPSRCSALSEPRALRTVAICVESEPPCCGGGFCDCGAKQVVHVQTVVLVRHTVAFAPHSKSRDAASAAGPAFILAPTQFITKDVKIVFLRGRVRAGCFQLVVQQRLIDWLTSILLSLARPAEAGGVASQRLTRLR